jgi:hypothetical protein
MKTKYISIRTLTAAAATVALLGLAGASPVSADQVTLAAGGTVHVGPQAPPPPQEDHQWASPYRTAVWIAGHNEWKDGGYVWVGGYYSYPPQENNHWVAPVYSHTEQGYLYESGHWSK